MDEKFLFKRQQVIEILSILALLATGVCLYMEGVTLASLIILSLEIPCVVLIFIENRSKVKDIVKNIEEEKKVESSLNNVLEFPKVEQNSEIIAVLNENDEEISIESLDVEKMIA